MPWKRLCCVLFLCVLLTGCGGKPAAAQEALLFRTALMEAGGCGFAARVQADFGDQVYDFTMDCETDRSATRLEVLEPEALAGIAATVSADGASLSYDGAELTFGELGGGRVPTVTSPWLLTRCWLEAYISHSGRDGDLERVTYLEGYDEAQLQVDTWFQERVPVYAEVFLDGVRCLSIELHDFHMR